MPRIPLPTGRCERDIALYQQRFKSLKSQTLHTFEIFKRRDVRKLCSVDQRTVDKKASVTPRATWIRLIQEAIIKSLGEDAQRYRALCTQTQRFIPIQM